MHFARIALPQKNCVSVDFLRRNERIGHSEEAESLGLFIAAAEGLIERRTGRAIMKQTFRLTTTQVQPRLILWYPPMEGDITILKAGTVVGGVGADTPLDQIRQGAVDMLPFIELGNIILPFGKALAGSSTVEYESGVENPAQVPAVIRQAVLLLAGHYYRNREAAQTDTRISTTDKALPFGVDDLIASYRIPNVNAPYYT